MSEEIVAVDVAKAELVIYQDAAFSTIPNETKDIRKWLNKFKGKQIDLFAFEATGGYERKLIECLEEKSLPYRRIHANYVRAYAKALGILAKTDNIDAKVIHDYSHAVSLKPASAKNENQGLSNLLNRRDQLIVIRIEETNRLDTMTDKTILQSLNAHIKWLNKAVDTLDNQLVEHAKSDNSIKFLYDLYISVPGVGLISALRLIADLPELLEYTDKQLAAMVGLAPMNRDSGQMRGKRSITAGRAKLRRVLYMATISAIRCNPLLKEFYQRLKSRGKPSKVAIIACTRKLLMVMRSIAQRKTRWEPVK